MHINLQNEVIILDEAHNIEDFATEASGGNFRIEEITFTRSECEKIQSEEYELYRELATFLSSLECWME